MHYVLWIDFALKQSLWCSLWIKVQRLEKVCQHMLLALLTNMSYVSSSFQQQQQRWTQLLTTVVSVLCSTIHNFSCLRSFLFIKTPEPPCRHFHKRYFTLPISNCGLSRREKLTTICVCFKNMFNMERAGLCIGTRSGMLSVKRDSNVIKLDIQPLL